jgi:hypothetical protein
MIKKAWKLKVYITSRPSRVISHMSKNTSLRESQWCQNDGVPKGAVRIIIGMVKYFITDSYHSLAAEWFRWLYSTRSGLAGRNRSPNLELRTT